MKALQKIIRTLKLDAMTPEFKAANDELLKAIKLNDKSGAIPHAEFEAVNKAFKTNDAGKAAELLKKIQLGLSKAEKKLNDEVKEVSQREADAKKENEDAKLKSKNAKATQGLFDKAKTLANSLKTSPKSASKLTPIAEKLKAYGDISGKANKVIQLVAANKDASKQIDILIKAIDSAEKKFKKELAEIQKSEKAAKDKLEVSKMRSKVTKGKLDAFAKERLSIAKVVKQIPGADLRQERNSSKTNPVYQIVSDGQKLYDSARTAAIKISDRYSKYKMFLNDYESQCKKLVWSAFEKTPHYEAGKIIKSAYKYTYFGYRKDLINALNEATKKIESEGGNPKKCLGEVEDFIRSSVSKFQSKFSIYENGQQENGDYVVKSKMDAGDERKAVEYVLNNYDPFKTKYESLSNEFKQNKEQAKEAGFSGISLFRNLGK